LFRARQVAELEKRTSAGRQFALALSMSKVRLQIVFAGESWIFPGLAAFATDDNPPARD